MMEYCRKYRTFYQLCFSLRVQDFPYIFISHNFESGFTRTRVVLHHGAVHGITRLPEHDTAGLAVTADTSTLSF